MSVGAGPVRFHGLPALLGWVLGCVAVGAGLLLHLAVCRPRSSCALLALVGGGWLIAVHPVAAFTAVFLAMMACWSWELLHPASWQSRAVPRLRAWWRSPWVYRRRWSAAMHVAELGRTDVDGVERLPRYVRLRCTATTDVVHVRGLLGQRFSEWEDAGPMLAHVFGATAFAVHRGDNRRLTLELQRGQVGRAWNRGAHAYMLDDLER